MFANAGVSGAMLILLSATPVLACHPQGSIIKEVQDVTTNSKMVDANTAADALAVNQGDILTYTITIANAETVEGDQNQADMLNTVMTDTLPAGVQLVSNPSTTTISESLGSIKAKGSVAKTYQVKVTATTDGAVLTNKACYTSTSNLGKSYDQNGCDAAIVKVHVPTPVPTPTPTPTPTPPVVTTTSVQVTPKTTLPNTGAGNVVVPALVATAIGYFSYLLRLRRKPVTERA